MYPLLLTKSTFANLRNEAHENKELCLNFKAAANVQYPDKIKVCLLLFIQSQIIGVIDSVLLYKLTLFLYHDHDA